MDAAQRDFNPLADTERCRAQIGDERFDIAFGESLCLQRRGTKWSRLVAGLNHDRTRTVSADGADQSERVTRENIELACDGQS